MGRIEGACEQPELGGALGSRGGEHADVDAPS
jgi:hypothetical protein